MRAARSTNRALTEALPATDPVVVLLQELLARQAKQDERLERIERLLDRGRGARDAQDIALLVAVVESIGDRAFTSSELMAHTEADSSLSAALLAADVTTTRELGHLFRRLEGIPLGGFRLERVGDQRAGVAWRVQVWRV